MRTQGVRSRGPASCLRHLCDQPWHKPPGNQTMRENAELIESSGNRQPAAVGEHSQCLLDDVVRTLINACPLSLGGLLRLAVLILAQPSRADRHDGYANVAQLLFQG